MKMRGKIWSWYQCSIFTRKISFHGHFFELRWKEVERRIWIQKKSRTYRILLQEITRNQIMKIFSFIEKSNINTVVFPSWRIFAIKEFYDILYCGFNGSFSTKTSSLEISCGLEFKTPFSRFSSITFPFSFWMTF